MIPGPNKHITVMVDFKDNFSRQSRTYSKYRPTYPNKLFDYLSRLTENHDLAWDCATGNGQAAVSLTKFFKAVYASDLSEQQIKHATPHPLITYKVESAEHSTLKNRSVDLITIAQALHWFDFDKFYKEAKRVLKVNGVIAAWTYGLPAISKEIDQLIMNFHDQTLADYWQYENSLVENEYSTISFPFDVIKQAVFIIQKDLSLHELIGLLNSWSAVPRFIEKNKHNPVKEIKNELTRFWHRGQHLKMATWKLTVKVGKNFHGGNRA